MKYVLAFLIIVVALGVSGCATSPGKVYSGTYFYNFESSSFTPDGTDEHWCLNGNMERAELPGKTASGPWGTAHVVGAAGSVLRVITATWALPSTC